MITVEFITALFSEVDEQLRTIPKHPEAHLWPSEVVRSGRAYRSARPRPPPRPRQRPAGRALMLRRGTVCGPLASRLMRCAGGGCGLRGGGPSGSAPRGAHGVRDVCCPWHSLSVVGRQGRRSREALRAVWGGGQRGGGHGAARAWSGAGGRWIIGA